MKKKPWSIIVLSVLHWISPIGNILVNAYQTQVSVPEFVSALFIPGNEIHFFVLVLLPLISGFCIFHCRKWSYAVYICLMIIPFIYSFMTLKGNYELYDVTFRLLVYFVNVLIVGYFMMPNIRNIYFNPRIRWWQTDPRFETDFLAEIFLQDEKIGSGQIKNISVGGFFIAMTEALELEKNVNIRFSSEEQKFDIVGRPVFHRTFAPAGYGFKMEIGESKKSGVRELVKKLKAKGALVQGRAPSPEDSFKSWLSKAWRSRSAWIPEVPGAPTKLNSLN